MRWMCMRRIVRLTFVVLFAGAVTNVLVAWCAALFGPWAYTEQVSTRRSLSADDAARLWRGCDGESRFQLSTGSREHNALSSWFVVSAHYRAPDMPKNDQSAVLHVYRFGWPLQSLEWSITHQANPFLTVSRHRWGWFEHVNDNGTTEKRGLPVRPVLFPFVVNTLISCALWCLIVLFPFGGYWRIRRDRRRVKGLCASCAYDLRGMKHARCPECGSALR